MSVGSEAHDTNGRFANFWPILSPEHDARGRTHGHGDALEPRAVRRRWNAILLLHDNAFVRRGESYGTGPVSALGERDEHKKTDYKRQMLHAAHRSTSNGLDNRSDDPNAQ